MKNTRIKALFISSIFALTGMMISACYEQADAQTVSENRLEEKNNAENISVVETDEVSADKATIKYSGVDGDLDWSIDMDGMLTISGAGDYGDIPSWSTYYEEIRSAKVVVTEITTMSYMFVNCYNMEKVDFAGTDTSSVMDMSYMFSGCSGLSSIDLSMFETENVTDMRSMFSGCSGLSSIDLSRLNTENVTDMSRMFGECSGLNSIDLNAFETGKVTCMEAMFSGCSGLSSIDLSALDTRNVTSMFAMFSGCSGLSSMMPGSKHSVFYV